MIEDLSLTKELQRLTSLSSYNLDFTENNLDLHNLVCLASMVAGTKFADLNILDELEQWGISNTRVKPKDPITRKESICNYTILSENDFEVKDLTADKRFNNKQFVIDSTPIKYYYGIPLQSDDGENVGALSVVDDKTKNLSGKQKQMLKLIANEISAKLNLLKIESSLRDELEKERETQRKLVHDIRGPLSGISGLSAYIVEEGKDNTFSELLTYTGVIKDSSNSLLNLIDDILNQEIQLSNDNKHCNLNKLKTKIIHLYQVLALTKNIELVITSYPETESLPIRKIKLLQIVGNLISNAIKFTYPGGKVVVDLNLNNQISQKTIQVKVIDNGKGFEDIELINRLNSTEGTSGEKGYGLGLRFVFNLVKDLNGSIEINGNKPHGTAITVCIPQ